MKSFESIVLFQWHDPSLFSAKSLIPAISMVLVIMKQKRNLKHRHSAPSMRLHTLMKFIKSFLQLLQILNSLWGSRGQNKLSLPQADIKLNGRSELWEGRGTPRRFGVTVRDTGVYRFHFQLSLPRWLKNEGIFLSLSFFFLCSKDAWHKKVVISYYSLT